MGADRARQVTLPRFIKSAAKLSQCPDDIQREVALIGRSNVGKSSLLNALLGQNLVRKSNTPGRTQLINFFESKHHDIFVDLPGYGYADVPYKVKRGLDQMIQDYLTNRGPLALVLLLLDARREKPSELDLAHFDFARSNGRRVLCVVTKIDRVPKAQRKPTFKKIASAMGVPVEDLLAVSSDTGDGINDLTKRLVEEQKA